MNGALEEKAAVPHHFPQTQSGGTVAEGDDCMDNATLSKRLELLLSPENGAVGECRLRTVRAYVVEETDDPEVVAQPDDVGNHQSVARCNPNYDLAPCRFVRSPRLNHL